MGSRSKYRWFTSYYSMTSNESITDKQRKLIYEGYKHGTTPAVIAKQFNLHVVTVRKVIREEKKLETVRGIDNQSKRLS
jgi:DNA invertase Pin-like site-specific DNA recombinase